MIVAANSPLTHLVWMTVWTLHLHSLMTSVPFSMLLSAQPSLLLRYRETLLHVHLDKVEKDFTCFLWLSYPVDLSSPFVTFHFMVVLLGANCCPFMLNATITYLLKRNESLTFNNLIHNLYVNSVVSGSHSEEAAVDYFTQSRSILRRQGKISI